MMDSTITRAEHEEFARRIEAEHKRQNRRLELLEENVRQVQELTVSVKELALSVKQMCKEQERQSERLEALESRSGDSHAMLDQRLDTLEGRDGEKWRKVVSYVTTSIIGILLGFIASQLGLK